MVNGQRQHTRSESAGLHRLIGTDILQQCLSTYITAAKVRVTHQKHGIDTGEKKKT